MTGLQVFDLGRTNRRNLFNLERLQKGVIKGGHDAVVAASLPNVNYSGGSFQRSATLLTLVVTTADGRQGMVVNEADYYYYRKYSWITEMRSFRYLANTASMNATAIGLLADLLKEMGLSHANIGVDQSAIPSVFVDQLERLLPQATLGDGRNAFDYARLIKTPGEIELFRYAALYSDKAIATAFANTRPSDTEKTVAARMQASVLALGADLIDHTTPHLTQASTPSLSTRGQWRSRWRWVRLSTSTLAPHLAAMSLTSPETPSSSGPAQGRKTSIGDFTKFVSFFMRL